MIGKISTGSNIGDALAYGAGELNPRTAPQKTVQVELLATYNLGNVSARGMAREMEAVADGSRCKRPMWHTSLSLKPGEQLTADEWRQAAERYCQEIGANPDRHQIAIYQHHDTAHQHIHIYINRVPIDQQPALITSHQYRVSMNAVRRVEEQLGLSRAVPLPEKNLPKNPKRALQPGAEYIRDSISKTLSENKPTSIEALVASLAKLHITAIIEPKKSGQWGTQFRYTAPDQKRTAKISGGDLGYKYAEITARLTENQAQIVAQAIKTTLDGKPTTFDELVADLKKTDVEAIVNINAEEVSFKKGQQPIAGSAMGYTFADLARQLDANRAEYLAEIEQLKKDLEDAGKAVPETVETEKIVEVVREVIKSDPVDQVEIERLKKRETELADLVRKNYDAWKYEKERADKVPETIIKQVEVIKHVEVPDPRDQATIDSLRGIMEKQNAMIEERNLLIDQLRKGQASASITATATPPAAQDRATVAPQAENVAAGLKKTQPAPVQPQLTPAEKIELGKKLFKTEYGTEITDEQWASLLAEKRVDFKQIGKTFFMKNNEVYMQDMVRPSAQKEQPTAAAQSAATPPAAQRGQTVAPQPERPAERPETVQETAFQTAHRLTMAEKPRYLGGYQEMMKAKGFASSPYGGTLIVAQNGVRVAHLSESEVNKLNREFMKNSVDYTRAQPVKAPKATPSQGVKKSNGPGH